MIDRQKRKNTTDFETLHHQYIAEWDLGTENIILTDKPHTNYNFRAYLSWYLGATWAKLKGQWTEADYGDISLRTTRTRRTTLRPGAARLWRLPRSWIEW